MQEHFSPSRRYRLEITSKETKPGCWNYTTGSVYEGSRLIGAVERNYSSFPFSWVEGHCETGGDYLVCGADYQGQTVVDLKTGDRVDHVPLEADHGAGFCWAAHYPSPDGSMLAVEGCYWACPYEIIIVDFRSPMAPPFNVLARSDEDHFRGWDEDGSCVVAERHSRVNLPGHELHGKCEGDLNLEQVQVVDSEAEERDIGDVDDPGWEDVFTERRISLGAR